jgi:hypothetical protein
MESLLRKGMIHFTPMEVHHAQRNEPKASPTRMSLLISKHMMGFHTFCLTAIQVAEVIIHPSHIKETQSSRTNHVLLDLLAAAIIKRCESFA